MSELHPEVKAFFKEIGSRTSARKKASCLANGIRGGAVRQGTSTCTCTRAAEADPLKHENSCRLYRAAYQRERRRRVNEAKDRAKKSLD